MTSVNVLSTACGQAPRLGESMRPQTPRMPPGRHVRMQLDLAVLAHRRPEDLESQDHGMCRCVYILVRLQKIT